jgi:hypothetical protein
VVAREFLLLAEFLPEQPVEIKDLKDHNALKAKVVLPARFKNRVRAQLPWWDVCKAHFELFKTNRLSVSKYKVLSHKPKPA